MTTKKWWRRGAVALLATGLFLQAPAHAAPSLGTLSPEEEKQREEFRKALKALPTAAQLSKNGLVTGTLDTVLPGAGTLYLTSDLSPAIGTTTAVVVADLVVLGAAAWYADAQGGNATQNMQNLWVPVGVGVAAAHLLVGGVGGLLKTNQYNAALPGKLAEAESYIQKQIAAIDKAEQDRAKAKTEARDRALSQARSLYAQGKLEWALSSLPSGDADDEVRALRAEITATLEAKKAAYAEAKAKDDAYRLKKGRELLDKILADAARHASQRNYEHALALLNEVPDGIPAEWKQEVAQRTNEYRQAETRAGGREKLRQERTNAVKQQLFAAVNRGDRAGALKKLDEYNSMASSGMMGGRGFLLSEGAGKIQNGNLQQGEVLLVQGQVETVLPGGVMLLVQNPVGGVMTFLARAHGMQTDERALRVFVKAGNLGAVDGDNVVLGVRAAGTYSYTTVAGGRGTVRAVELRTRLQ